MFRVDQILAMDPGDGRAALACTVVALGEAGELQLRFPGLSDVPPWMPVGAKVLLEGADGRGRHAGTTHVRSWVTALSAAPALVATVDRPFPMRTVQNRRFFRLPASVPLRVGVLSSARRPASVGLRDEFATTQDVSAGGMRLLTRLPLEEGDRIEITMVPGSAQEELVVPARVIRVSPWWSRRQSRSSVACEFQVREGDRDRLVRWMFELQLDPHLQR